MIPGNRPEDEGWDDFYGEVDGDCGEYNICVEEARYMWSMALQERLITRGDVLSQDVKKALRDRTLDDFVRMEAKLDYYDDIEEGIE